MFQPESSNLDWILTGVVLLVYAIWYFKSNRGHK